ncbi:putative disease resistance protein At1g50180 [Cornus florida]|uniref:putative disease resistance protein At1g50180 n=1 Tax=Cornus florida TaxID=4283 RepID=UPI002896E47F|nr:putative disease resistance protein At1g50180 [Cornus florida]XP_059656927.1 putative disease resistance protein At1g50180 [Cornus florida]
MAEIAVEFLLNHLTNFIQQESSLLGGIREEAESLRYELEHMKDFLKEADANEFNNSELQVWVKQVRDVAHDMEDVLDEFMLHIAHYHGDGFYGFLCNICSLIKNLIARHQIASEIGKIKSRVNNIHQSYRQRLSISEHGSSSTVDNNPRYDRRGDALLVEEAELVGMDGPKKQLIGWLLEDSPRLKSCFGGGDGGYGKNHPSKESL